VRRVTNKTDDKAQARAVRFGLVSDSMGGAITVVNSSQAEEKLKARSERFGGNPVASSSKGDDGDKRKIRLARFGGAGEGSGRKIINTAQDANKRF
jgi:hypothetical protein